MLDKPDIATAPTVPIVRDDTALSIHEDYRSFVGGSGPFWDEIADLQIKFLIENGLRPNHHFVDVACGALRGGTRIIPYLDQAHYSGVDKHIDLIIYGVAKELGIDVFAEKMPQFLITEDFNFYALNARPDYGIAQSLFTHLSDQDIMKCLANLRPRAADGCRFFATFFEKTLNESFANPSSSHSHGTFRFTREEMEQFGAASGWKPIYMGDWGHPRGQQMIEYRAA